MSAAERMEAIRQKVKVCQECPLHQGRKNAVPGEGPVNARVMCIGEGPGQHENEQGKPFVGQAGKFLDELLASGGLKREEVFITNVVKCRPPSNRDPEPRELAACRAYLDEQIELINPEIIVTLGRFSMGFARSWTWEIGAMSITLRLWRMTLKSDPRWFPQPHIKPAYMKPSS